MPSVLVEPPIEKWVQGAALAAMAVPAAVRSIGGRIAAKKAAKLAAQKAAAQNARKVGVVSGNKTGWSPRPDKEPMLDAGYTPEPVGKPPVDVWNTDPPPPADGSIWDSAPAPPPQVTADSAAAAKVATEAALAVPPAPAAPAVPPAPAAPAAVAPAAPAAGKSKTGTALDVGTGVAIGSTMVGSGGNNAAVQTAQQSAAEQRQNNLSDEATQEAGTTSGTQPGVTHGNTAKSHDNWRLLQEGEALRRGGDRPTGDRFVAVARALQKPNEIRDKFIQNYGHQAAELLGGEPELGEHLYQEGRGSPDFLDMRQSPSNYPDEDRRRFYSLMRKLGVGREREHAAQQQGQEMLSQLQTEDPSQYFADLPFRQDEPANPMSLGEGWENILGKALTPTALALLGPLVMRGGQAWWDGLRQRKEAYDEAREPEMWYDKTNFQYHDINPLNQPDPSTLAPNPGRGDIVDLDEVMRQRSISGPKVGVSAVDPNTPAAASVAVLPPPPQMDWEQHIEW